MLRKFRSRLRRRSGRGYRLADLALASIGQPRLFLAAFRHVTRRRARMVESGLRLAENRVALATTGAGPLDRPALIVGLAGQSGIVLLAEDAEQVRLGLAEVDLLSALWWLGQATHAPRIMIGGAAVSFASHDFRSRALAAREIAVHYTRPGGRADTIILEPYFCHEAGKWVSANPANTEARALYDARLETPGLTRLDDLLGAPSFDQRWRAREIDLVYTWVNHADPDWAALYRQHRAELDRPGDGPRPQSDDATALTRFHSNDELRYSLRSVAQNLPWVRQIYVLSNCAPPDWLDTGHPRLRWVRHDEVIPPEYLPTFNSHVIESCLHRIPGLAGHFIYMNDDFFVARPLGKPFFFDGNGAARALLEPYGKVLGPVVEGAPDYLNAARNSAALIRETFGFVPTRLHRHAPYALRRDVMAEIEARWPAQIAATRRNLFRTAHDLNVASFLAHHYGLATGRTTLGAGRSVLVKSQDVRWRTQLAQALADTTDVFCINEGGADPPGRDWQRTVRRALAARWPEAAGWEHDCRRASGREAEAEAPAWPAALRRVQ
ncbi:MAG: stealth conserved region 3 domain-containing protein [Rubellimicrobium sp.]|nr:stealth conserved region 3 domain-containing protein [Rubellimicrobium sp.]